MSRAEPATEHGAWCVGDHEIRIEWPAMVLEEIREAAVEGFHRLARGGVEIGGVLFGTHEGGLVRIAAFRPVACEHAFGPGFVLSENDQAGLRKTIEAAAGDRALSGLEPVGWYHSHTRSEIFLSAPDLEIHDRFFPEAWQIALVLRPAGLQPARAGFFFREAGGSVRSQSSHREFMLEPVARPAAPTRAAGVEAIETEAPAAEEPSPRPEPSQRFRWLWITLLMCAVAAAAGVLVKTYWLVEGEETLALQVTDVGGHLRIEWNRAASPVRDAAGGSLEIRDGSESVALPIDAGRLREGRVSYARRSENVDVRLKVRRPDGRVVEEVVQ
ncbi:MAG: hypothetical protein AAB225_01680, partial [Acidobacteriota bacterium]